MIITILILIFAASIIVDIFLMRRLFEQHRHMRARVLAVAIAADCIPILLAVSAFCVSDNSQRVMNAEMWLSTIYIIAVVPKLLGGATVLALRGKWSIAAGFCVWLAMFAVLIHGAVETRTMLRVESVDLSFDELPEAADGMRIVLFSDLHIGALMQPQREIAALVERINSLSPDLVVFGGDLVNIRATELTESVIKQLSGIKARYGVVSVIGNHDTGAYIKDTIAMPHELNTQMLVERQHAAGWRVLADSTEFLRIGTDSIAITGLEFKYANRDLRHTDSEELSSEVAKLYAALPPHIFDITVSHVPQTWSRIIASTASPTLTLSGHVHAMQMKAKIFGTWYSPAQLLYKQWSGLYREGDNVLYINDGIGAVGYYLRLGARPELTLIRLHRTGAAK